MVTYIENRELFCYNDKEVYGLRSTQNTHERGNVDVY